MSTIIVGIDEAGRGPLAGPVSAAAVILDDTNPIEGLMDSKKISEKKRERLFIEIKQKALAYGIALVSPAEIDRTNILQASLLAMQQAVAKLSIAPTHALVDGNRGPILNCTVECIIKGDEKIPAISAASILAKVTRDHLMIELDAQYPGYGLAKHKGYPTKAHCQALTELGITPIHRRSFGPVRKISEE